MSHKVRLAFNRVWKYNPNTILITDGINHEVYQPCYAAFKEEAYTTIEGREDLYRTWIRCETSEGVGVGMCCDIE